MSRPTGDISQDGRESPAATSGTGSNGVFEVIAMLQGLDIPTVAWERDVFPARVENYRPEWLDELCLGGESLGGGCIRRASIPTNSKPMAGVTASYRCLCSCAATCVAG